MFLARISAGYGPILVQQKVDGSAFFGRTWDEFKVGFGDVSGNYWLGNDAIHNLTQYGKYRLRVELQSNDTLQWFWAEYSTFVVADETALYELQVGGFSGNVSVDALGRQSGMKFTTTDRDNDATVFTNCATFAGGGFWYAACGDALLNGAETSDPQISSFMWRQMTAMGGEWNLKTSRMFIYAGELNRFITCTVLVEIKIIISVLYYVSMAAHMNKNSKSIQIQTGEKFKFFAIPGACFSKLALHAYTRSAMQFLHSFRPVTFLSKRVWLYSTNPCLIML